jgi:hypothetical protein
MSFLTPAERASLEIEAMILHVVGDTEPFVPEPERPVEHEAFFIARIVDTDASAVHSFNEGSITKAGLERIARGQDTFELGAQELSRQFARWHGTTAGDGAFFIFSMRVEDPRVRIYSLVKYDYREAIEQMDDAAGESHLRRVVHAFIDDKRAIQKSALVRVVDGQAEVLVAARDRVRAPPDIADYFAGYLDVTRSRNDEELNRAVVEVLRKTLQDVKEVLPQQDVPQALRHAQGVLRDRQQIDEAAIEDAILAAAGNPAEEAARINLQRRTAHYIDRQKLNGLAFPPDRQVLRRPPIRRLKTVEGVTVTYPDEAGIVTVQRGANPNGGAVITITTDRIEEDAVVADRTRRGD